MVYMFNSICKNIQTNKLLLDVMRRTLPVQTNCLRFQGANKNRESRFSTFFLVLEMNHKSWELIHLFFKQIHFYLVGWVLPVVTIIPYIAVHWAVSEHNDKCWTESMGHLEWIHYPVPLFCLSVSRESWNSFILLSFHSISIRFISFSFHSIHFYSVSIRFISFDFHSLTGKLHFAGKHTFRAFQEAPLITSTFQDCPSCNTLSGSCLRDSLHVLCYERTNHGILWLLLQLSIFLGCCHWLPSGYICINHFLFPQFWGE